MWIYIVYILVTLIAYHAITGGSNAYRLSSGIVVQRNRKIFSWVAGILLWAILALRDVSVGSDTINYYSRYVAIQKPEFSLLSVAGQEWGYDMLQYLCWSVGMSWQVYLAVVSAIIILPVTIFFHKYSTDVWASYFLYITIGLFAINMSAIRQSLAVAMVVMAMVAMFEKKYVRFAIFLLIGSLFHFSALFTLLLLFVPFFKYKSKRQLVLLLIIPILARVISNFFFVSIDILMPERYLDSYLGDQVINPLLEAIWISTLLFILYSFLINGNIQSIDFQFYFIIVLYVASIELSYGVYLAGRLALYFEIAVMVAIPCAIAKFHNRTTRNILSRVIYFLCLAFMIVSSFGSDTLVIFNYKFCWQ